MGLFLGGLRNGLHGSGVHVLTIKPGFVDTPMTADFSKGIRSAQKRRRDVVDLRGFWLMSMRVIRLIHESIFKRLSL